MNPGKELAHASPEILVAEDSPTQAENLKYVLEQAGYPVSVARNGKEALTMVETSEPTLVISDVIMPEMNGYELCRRLKADPHRRDIPVILLTSLSDPVDVIRGLECGADNFIVKPCDSEYLLSRITYILANRQLRASERVELGVEIFFAGQKHTITSNRLQILNLLLGTYELAVQKNLELIKAQSELRDLNEHLEQLVAQRTAALRAEIAERKRAEEALQQEGQISAALARVGRELIALVSLPAILDRLCQLTTELLGCDCSYTFLWHEKGGAYLPVSGFGDSPEQWESRRALKIPHALVAPLLEHLEHEEAVQTHMAEHVPSGAMAAAYSITVGLCIALRRGGEIIGIHSAGYRGRLDPFTAQQERIARGMGQLVSLALENARLVEELERANRLKADFVANMSHELRTPLHIMTGYNELLLSGDLGRITHEQSDALRVIDHSAHGLLELINATLDVGRLDAGQLPAELREIHLPDLIAELDAETRDLQDKSGLHFGWYVPPDMPPLLTDPTKLKVVLKSLIDNAAKFTEHGNVTVSAHGRDGGIEICVADTGIGMGPEALPIIFEPFRQVDGSTTRRYGGVGLGLYLARRLLDLLGGTIAVASQVGQGSTFRVSLPIRPSRGANAAEEPRGQVRRGAPHRREVAA